MAALLRLFVDRIAGDGLPTLAVVSKIEGGLRASLASDAVDALTADDTVDGLNTAELDALDESLVESIGEYASSEPEQPANPVPGATDPDSATVADEGVRFDSADVADTADVSTGIIEELRRADIDGPIVDHAPQDDTTSTRRRPNRPVDFDPAPVPVPPPMPAVINNISAPSISSEIRSRSSIPAARPISGFAPAPSPLVILVPNCNKVRA